MSNRIDKVNELIYRELGMLITREIELPSDVFVTISSVKVSPDLKESKVWVSIFPANKKGSTLKILNKKARLLQSLLRKKLSLKYIPNLRFALDTTEEEAAKLEDLINEQGR